MSRCVIVGGADINNYEYIRSQLREDDYIIFCDSGLKHLESLQAKPGLIVGDFDSHDNPHFYRMSANYEKEQKELLAAVEHDEQAVRKAEQEKLI